MWSPVKAVELGSWVGGRWLEGTRPRPHHPLAAHWVALVRCCLPTCALEMPLLQVRDDIAANLRLKPNARK